MLAFFIHFTVNLLPLNEKNSSLSLSQLTLQEEFVPFKINDNET